MTPQEMFNKAYLGLRAQGKKSLTESLDRRGNKNARCAYSAADGCHCGVGFLISPEVGRVWDDHFVGINSVLMQKLDGVEPWMVENSSLLGAIQQAHDDIINWETDFEDNFADVADEFGLEVPA